MALLPLILISTQSSHAFWSSIWGSTTPSAPSRRPSITGIPSSTINSGHEGYNHQGGGTIQRNPFQDKYGLEPRPQNISLDDPWDGHPHGMKDPGQVSGQAPQLTPLVRPPSPATKSTPPPSPTKSPRSLAIIAQIQKDRDTLSAEVERDRQYEAQRAAIYAEWDRETQEKWDKQAATGKAISDRVQKAEIEHAKFVAAHPNLPTRPDPDRVAWAKIDTTKEKVAATTSTWISTAIKASVHMVRDVNTFLSEASKKK